MKRECSFTSKDGKHRTVECPHCEKNMRSDKLKGHLLTHNIRKPCKYCKKDIRSDLLLKHELLCQSKVDETLCNRYTGVHEHLDSDSTCSSVSGFFKSFELDIEVSADYDQIISSTCQAAKTKLSVLLQKHPIKAQIIIGLSFYKQVQGEKDTSDKAFRSLCEPLLVGDSIDEFLSRAKVYIRASIEQYERLGSGWIFDKFHCSHLEVAKYSPLSASGTVKIPRKIKKMKSVLNITSPDNRCFLYCLVAGHLNLVNLLPKHPERYSKYIDKLDSIKMGSVSFSVEINDIPKIEKLNGLSI